MYSRTQLKPPVGPVEMILNRVALILYVGVESVCSDEICRLENSAPIAEVVVNLVSTV